MDRNREARRVAMATSNGISKRRRRTSSRRDSPGSEDDEALELREPARFRDRTRKKDRDRDKERSERGRLSRSKRRRRENCMHKEDGVDDSSEESLNDDEDQEDVPVSSSSIPSSKVLKVQPTWRGPVETITFTVPRKARTACTKRPHDSWSSGEQILRQASSSPLRPSPAPVSPSSSSLSMKMKIVNGAKQRPQKSSSKSALTVQDEIEIEVAEVLYGLMRQCQGSSKPETMQNDSAKCDSREASRSTGDTKSRASSPISNSGSVELRDSPAMLQKSSSSTPPLSAVAPKRKRPRPVIQLEETPAGFASLSSPISTAANPESDLAAKEEVHPSKPGNKSDSAVDNGGLPLDITKSHGPQSTPETTRSDPASGVLSSDDNLSLGKETIALGKAEEQSSVVLELTKATTTTSDSSEKESRGEEKIEIDLMAPPPQSRSSLVREREVDHNGASKFTDREAELKSKPSEGDEEKAGKSISSDSNAVVVEKGAQSSPESGAKDGSTQKVNARKIDDLHLDLERSGRNAAPIVTEESKLNQELPLLNLWRNDTSTDKTAQPSSLPSPMSVPPRWPAGLPPMGFAPLQGVVSMDGRSMAPTAVQPPPHFLFTQPRPSRCATHGYIAKNVFSHQQLMKNYPLWAAPVGSAPLIGASAKPYNLNVVPPATGLHGNAQIKQFYQSLQSGGGSNNIMHGPATLFSPLGQQQQVTAAGAAASVKSAAPSTSTSTSVPNASASSGQTSSSTTMSFNHQNMPANEAQYRTMLANGAYQFPIPAHVGATQAYRGAHPQVMPFFNGSYYPYQMLHHPSRLQQQQQAPPGAQHLQFQQNQQNPSVSIASSSSQRHTLNQQQRPQGSSANGATTSLSLHNFPTRASQTQQLEMGGEGSSSIADSRLSRPSNSMNVYGHNFSLPFNPSSAAAVTMSNHAEKKQQQPHTQQLQQRQAFALPFASMNGAARNNYQIMAAAQTAYQRKNHHGFEDGKSLVPDCSNPADERKGKGTDAGETSAPKVSRTNVLDSSAQSLGLPPGFVHSSRTPATASMSDRELQKHLQNRVAPFTSNGSMYCDQLAGLATKFPPIPVVQGSNTQTHSRQWQNSGRTITQQGHTQISFGRDLKAAAPSQGQNAGATQSPPPPSTSSSYSNQAVKNSIAGRNGACVAGNSQMAVSSSMGSSKPRLLLRQ